MSPKPNATLGFFLAVAMAGQKGHTQGAVPFLRLHPGLPAVEGCRKRRAGRSALGSGFPDGHSFSSGHLLAQLWGGESVLVKAARFGFW